MQQTITITRENVNDIAKGLSASANYLGFRKNGKEMVPSQALILLAKLKGLNEHTLLKELEKPAVTAPAEDLSAHAISLLGGLTRYLIRNYGDDQWDSCTRDMLEEANALLGREPIEWALDDDNEGYTAPAREHSVETAKALLLGQLGYTFAPDVDQPGLWVWRNGNEGCESSFNSLDDALADIWTHVTSTVVGSQNLSDGQWDALSFAQQSARILEVLGNQDEVTEMAQAMRGLEAQWGTEHPWYGRDEWREDVAQGITKLGYWEWVQHCLEGNGGPEAHCTACGQPSANGEGWDGKCGDCADKDVNEAERLEQAESLGISLDDVKFWVKQHFSQEFDVATPDQQTDWLHSYRQHNGLTPKG